MRPDPHPSHFFAPNGICHGCGMRRDWPGAITSCPIRHDYSMTTEERAAQKAMRYAAKKRYTARVRSGKL